MRQDRRRQEENEAFIAAVRRELERLKDEASLPSQDEQDAAELSTFLVADGEKGEG